MHATQKAYVASDLHLGSDADADLEDFFQDAEFARFADAIAPGETLFLNGDIVDFAQIPPYDVPEDSRFLWPESASLAKLESALSAHSGFWEALKRMLARNARIAIINGNHDLDMAWPRVRDRIRGFLAPPEHDLLQFKVDSTVYGGVHIEHGHAFTPENCPADPANFVREFDDGSGLTVPYLERVWGTDFMLRFYNDLERKHPYADNVKPMLKVLFYGLRQGYVGAAEMVRLLVFLKRGGLPWSGIISAVLEAPAATPQIVLGSLEGPWAQVVRDRMMRDPQFASGLQHALDGLSAEERYALTRPVRPAIIQPEPAEGGATLGLFREDRELRAGRDRLSRPGVTHVVFGHTHEPVDGELDGRLFNPGTWLPHMDLSSPEIAAKVSRDGMTLEMLRDSSLYTVVRRVVEISPDPQDQASVRTIVV
jgi:UDP-2,3-diacylglucosamine pyrophosphatase LpxH